MAKYKNQGKHDGKLVKISTPSWFGSHKSMVVEELEDGRVVCEDQTGRYVTTKNVLDNGLADPNRFGKR